MMVVLATCACLQRATTPYQATLPQMKWAAASAASCTCMRIVTCGWRLHWRGWGVWSWWWVWSLLNGKWCLWVDSTYPIFVSGAITLHADIPLFSPTLAPGVFNYPVIQTITVSSIPHDKNTMIQVRPTCTCKHTLKTCRKDMRFDSNTFVSCTKQDCCLLHQK